MIVRVVIELLIDKGIEEAKSIINEALDFLATSYNDEFMILEDKVEALKNADA